MKFSSIVEGFVFGTNVSAVLSSGTFFEPPGICIQCCEHYKATRYFISLTATLIKLAYFRKKPANDKVDMMNRIHLYCDIMIHNNSFCYKSLNFGKNNISIGCRETRHAVPVRVHVRRAPHITCRLDVHAALVSAAKVMHCIQCSLICEFDRK